MKWAARLTRLSASRRPESHLVSHTVHGAVGEPAHAPAPHMRVRLHARPRLGAGAAMQAGGSASTVLHTRVPGGGTTPPRARACPRPRSDGGGRAAGAGAGRARDLLVPQHQQRHQGVRRVRASLREPVAQQCSGPALERAAFARNPQPGPAMALRLYHICADGRGPDAAARPTPGPVTERARDSRLALFRKLSKIRGFVSKSGRSGGRDGCCLLRVNARAASGDFLPELTGMIDKLAKAAGEPDEGAVEAEPAKRRRRSAAAPAAETGTAEPKAEPTG